MTVATETEATTVARLAKQAVKPQLLVTSDPDAHIAVLPTGDGGATIVDLQQYAVRPRASTPRTVLLYDAESFAAYCEDATPFVVGARIVHDSAAQRITAILDDATFAVRRAVLQLQPTPEWRQWQRASDQGMTQEQFAEFVEAHLPEFVTPDGATMLEIAQTFHAAESARFTSGTRLSSGETRLVYEQEISAKAGSSGTVDVPNTVTIRITAFEQAPPVEITARFRYRLNSGKLTLSFVLDRPHDVTRAAFEAVSAAVRQRMTVEWLHTNGSDQ